MQIYLQKKQRGLPHCPSFPYPLPFKGEELCSIGRPVDGRRTLLGIGLYLVQLNDSSYYCCSA